MNRTKDKTPLVNELAKNHDQHREEFNKKRMAYFIAKATHDTTRQIDDEAGAAILNALVFKDENTGERITDPARAWNLSTSDFNAYQRLKHVEREGRGLHISAWTDSAGEIIPAYNTSADKDTFPALVEAERAFLTVALAILPAEMREPFQNVMERRGTAHYNRFLDLSLRLEAQEIDLDVCEVIL